MGAYNWDDWPEKLKPDMVLELKSESILEADGAHTPCRPGLIKETLLSFLSQKA